MKADQKYSYLDASLSCAQDGETKGHEVFLAVPAAIC